MHTIIYEGPIPWEYYLINTLTKKINKVTEERFFKTVGYDRYKIPMHRDKKNINKQNFYMNDKIIGFRIRR